MMELRSLEEVERKWKVLAAEVQSEQLESFILPAFPAVRNNPNAPTPTIHDLEVGASNLTSQTPCLFCLSFSMLTDRLIELASCSRSWVS